MKRHIFILFMLMPMLLLAQGQGLQIAPRGGVATWLGSDQPATLSPEGGLDLGYIIRCRVGRSTQLGLRTGVGVSYSSHRLSAEVGSQYERQDYMGNLIQYTTSASVQEQHQQLALDLPVLFALQTHGFALNIGPKLMWMAMDNYRQTVDKAEIDAYYPAYKVHVYNQPSTGMLATPHTTQGSGTVPTLHLLISAEIGYEWQIGERYSRYNEQYIGLQLYANYGVWNTGMRTQRDFLSVNAIMQPGTQPNITIGTICSSAQSLTCLSVGIRFYYTIQSVDYPGHGWHR